jgi:hypothetical protein
MRSCQHRGSTWALSSSVSKRGDAEIGGPGGLIPRKVPWKEITAANSVSFSHPAGLSSDRLATAMPAPGPAQRISKGGSGPELPISWRLTRLCLHTPAPAPTGARGREKQGTSIDNEEEKSVDSFEETQDKGRS